MDTRRMTRPRRWIGRWLFGVGIFNTALGIWLGAYSYHVPRVIKGLDSGGYEMLPFWFIGAGLHLILLGALTNWIEARAAPPRFLGWTLVTFAVLELLLVPESAFLLSLPMIVAAVGVLSRRRPQAQDGFSRRFRSFS